MNFVRVHNKNTYEQVLLHESKIVLHGVGTWEFYYDGLIVLETVADKKFFDTYFDKGHVCFFCIRHH